MLVLLATWPFWVVNLLIVLFLAISVVMLLTILIQKPQGGGLSAAFGAGASSGQTAFGAKTGDALTIFTIIIFALYIAFAVLLNWGAKITDPALEPAAAAEGATPSGGATPPADGATPAGATTPPAEGAAPAPKEGEQKPDGAAPTPGATPPVTPPATEPAKPQEPQTPAPAPASNPGGQPPAAPTTGPGR